MASFRNCSVVGRRMDTQTLVETLQLERLEVNLFRGTTADEEARERIYGRQ